MQRNLFFFLSSFFFDRLIYKTASKFNKELSVFLSNGKYILNSGKANYSFGNLHRAFQDAFSQTKLKDKQLESALILGFGAGSIAQILRQELYSNCAITGVEIDKEVIELGKKYFRLHELTNCEINIDDAINFLKCSQASFDLITVDLFTEIDVPISFQKQEFIELIKAHLNPNAMLYFNFVIDSKEQKLQFDTLKQKFKDTFPDFETLTVMESNRILVAQMAK